MTTTTKACTKCGQIKPLTDYYLIRATEPEGPRRPHCKACNNAERQLYRRRGPSIAHQIARRAADPNYPLIPEAEAALYTDRPIPPEVLATARKIRKRNRRKELELAKKARDDIRPMNWNIRPESAL